MFSRQVFSPCAELAPYVRAIAITETTEEVSYRMMPSTSPVVAFDYKGSIFAMENGAERKLRSHGIFGVHDACKQLRNAQDTGTLIVFFTETGASLFFNFPLHEIFGASYPLDCFIAANRIAEVEEQLSEAPYAIDKVKIAQRFLLSVLQYKKPDLLVTEAISRIKQSNGNIRMKELAQQLYISESRLEKRFRGVVGASPKKTASIIRIQTAIRIYSKNETMTSNAYNAGYFDQAHFIKDFKSFTGYTPVQFFKGNEANRIPVLSF